MEQGLPGWLIVVGIALGGYVIGSISFSRIITGAVDSESERSDIRQYVSLRRSGELQTEQFHDTIEQTHLGFFHKYVRRLGLLRYDYMTDD